MEFVYKIRDGQGRIQEQMATADSQNILRSRLISRGFDVVDIQAKANPVQDLNALWIVVKNYFEQVTLKDRVVFSRQFAAMVSAGVAMLRTLNIIVEQCPNKKLKSTLDEVRYSVESGLSLSDALAKHPKVFDKLYVSMVRAGETGGILAEVLQRLADFLEARQKLETKVRSAMVYPSMVLLVAIIVFWAMLTFILPIFQNLFNTIGGELPAYTQFLVMLSTYMRSVWMLLFIVCCGVGPLSTEALLRDRWGTNAYRWIASADAFVRRLDQESGNCSIQSHFRHTDPRRSADVVGFRRSQGYGRKFCRRSKRRTNL